MTVPDLYIIHGLKNKDQEVIARLYDQYAPALYGIVVRIVQSEPAAEDVLQDAFLKIWKNGPSYDEHKGSIFTWMLNIARNTAIDKTRSAAFRHSGMIQNVDDSVSNVGRHSYQMNPDHIGLADMVTQLDEKYRKVIELAYFQGYTQAEITEELGIPLGTVKSRMRIAIRTLKEFFSEEKVVLLILCTLLFL